MSSRLGFKALNKNVVVEIPVVEEKTASGIIKSPEQIQEEKSTRDAFLKVLSVGDDVTKVKEGDKILITNVNFDVYNFIDGIEFSIIDESWIVGVKG